jgi:hypothetical protein
MAGRPYVLRKVTTARRRGFRMKIITGLSAEQNGGPGIDKIEHLDDMLLFALGISGDAGGILKIHLDLLEWFTRLQRLVRALGGIENASELAQDFPDGAR